MSKTDIAISVQGVGKKYLIGHQKSGDLRNTLVSLRHKIGRTSDLEEFWALKDVSFEVQRGEAVGIIGRNGAGKSTLLKILSRITEPTTGRIEINGRVSSLLEVGTGFHPELTGRENIYLNGTILGMRRAEIKAKFDEIVAFSGVEKFIDTPVKHYSSGMKVRLAFSVAAHLEPEILIVDEVLAVGDAEFQKKCIGKMDEVSKNEGRTVLFVSHNMGAIKQLCNNCLLIQNGIKAADGTTDEVLDSYFNQSILTNERSLQNLENRKGSGLFKVKEILLTDHKFNKISFVRTGEDVRFVIRLDKEVDNRIKNFRIDLAFDNLQNNRVAWFSNKVLPLVMEDRFSEIILRIPRFPFARGSYQMTFHIVMGAELIDYIHQGYTFSVEDGDYFGTNERIPVSQTSFYVDHEIATLGSAVIHEGLDG